MHFSLSSGLLLLASLQPAFAADAPSELTARQANPHPSCKLAGNYNSCPPFVDTIPTGASTIDQCSQRCRSNPACKSFHVVQAENGGCWLYKDSAEKCKGPVYDKNPGWFFDVDCYQCATPPPPPPPPPPSAPACPFYKDQPNCNCVCLKKSDPKAKKPAPCQRRGRGCGCSTVKPGAGLWGFCV